MYKELDIVKLLSKEAEYLKTTKSKQTEVPSIFRNNDMVDGDCSLVNTYFSGSANLSVLGFEVKKTLAVKSVELLLNHATNTTSALEVTQNGTVISTAATLTVTGTLKTVYRFILPTTITLTPGNIYTLRATGTAKNYCKNYTLPFNKVDYGDYVYLTTTHNSVVMPNAVIPFGLVLDF